MATTEEFLTDNGSEEENGEKSAFEKLLSNQQLIERLSTPPSQQPPNRQQLPRDIQQTFNLRSDIAPQLLTALKPALGSGLYKAWEQLPVTAPAQFKVYAFRVQTAPFGHNAPARPDYYDDSRKLVIYDEWRIDDPLNQTSTREPARLSADFRIEPEGTFMTTGQEITLVNQSTGDYITSYEWDFGDGETRIPDPPSSREPIRYAFETSGSYTITLTVTGTVGTSTARRTIVISPPIG